MILNLTNDFEYILQKPFIAFNMLSVLEVCPHLETVLPDFLHWNILLVELKLLLDFLHHMMTSSS